MLSVHLLNLIAALTRRIGAEPSSGRLHWLLGLILVGCATAHDTWASTSTTAAVFDTVQLRPFGVAPRNAMGFKQQLLKTFDYELEGLRVSDIVRVQLVRTVLVKGAGRLRIYRVSLSTSLPEVWPKTAFVVRDTQGQAAWFWLDDLWLIKEQRAAHQYLLSGVNWGRGRGYYMVYAWAKGRYFRAILNSLTMPACPYGLPVYNASADCESYQPFQLTFSQRDLNADGYLDLVFTGRLLSFCRGLEMGFSQQDRPPIRSQKMRIVWLSQRKKGATTWRLQKNKFCTGFCATGSYPRLRSLPHDKPR